MEVAWYVYRFDYARFLEVRPALRIAVTPDDFAALVRSAEDEAVLDAVVEGDLSVYQARQAFLHADCCLGEPLNIDRSFAREVMTMTRRRGAEDAGEMLSELLGGGKNMERWLGEPELLLGFLTPDQTSTLLSALGRIVRRSGQSARSGRSAVLRPIAAAGAFLRLLLDRQMRSEDTLQLLAAAADAALERGTGIAVIAG